MAVIKSNRQCNLELLRIVCMFLVVAGHANYLVLDEINTLSIHNNLVTDTIRVFLYQLCVVAVNVFVFISGWFGINVSKKGLTLIAIPIGYGIFLQLIQSIIMGGDKL